MEFPGWKFLAVLLLLLGIPFLEFKGFAGFPLSAEKFPRWSFLGGVSWLAIPCFPLSWGKNCLGGLTWRESAGIFLPQQDLPGWSFVSGNSLVSRCLVASYLGGVSWVEVPCSAPALLGIPFLEFQGFAGFPLSAEKFPRWSFWVGHPGWQFFPFLCVGNQTLGGVSWVGHPGSLASSW